MPNTGLNQPGLVSGSTYYLVVLNQSGQFLVPGTPVFENYNAAHWTTYANGAATANSAGCWFGNFPTNAATVAGIYDVQLRLRAGASASIGDVVVAVETVWWDGASIVIPAEAGAEMDLVNSPNATAVIAIQSGLATEVTLNSVGTAVAATKADLDNLQTGAASGVFTAPALVNGVANQTHAGTAQAGTTTTITLDSGAVATDGYYANQILIIKSGAGAGQSAIIASYVGSTRVATFTAALAVAPDATSVFVLVGFGSVPATISGAVTIAENGIASPQNFNNTGQTTPVPTMSLTVEQVNIVVDQS